MIKTGENGLLLVMVMMGLILIQTSAQDESSNPTGLPECWAKVDNCQYSETGYHLLGGAAFSTLCCPVFNQQIGNVTCLCSIKDYVNTLPTNTSPTVLQSEIELGFNQVLSVCKVTGSYQSFCNIDNNGNNNDGKKSINGSNKFEFPELLPVILLIWAIVVS